MREIPKNMIGFSGKYFVQAMLIREGLPCMQGKEGVDLLVRLTKPRRQFSIFVVTNLQPKRAGGKGKEALDWWIPDSVDSDIIACVDLSQLRIWLFERDELPKLAQQKTASKYHLYMYTEKEVALRGKQSMKFDYEFETYKLENRVHRGMLDKRPRRLASVLAKRRAAKKRTRGRRAKRGAAKRARRGAAKRAAKAPKAAAKRARRGAAKRAAKAPKAAAKRARKRPAPKRAARRAARKAAPARGRR